MDMKNCFKFEIKNKSFYVYLEDNGNTVDEDTCNKGGLYIVSSLNLPVVSWALKYLKEMEDK
ncbi:hypothetical protein BU622_00580 [Staphylococcus capitis]|nr:hypothetical protein BU628_01215 [Staphylococcus capitis]PTG40229.1 hypothetical protein BU624_02300 [Staphylococcus capitis]PTH00885.1 hypothetical protein BU625_00045 [Staphylococcus capitis]PTH04615.1 hypothetical protein BU621_06595 [Staphylococcus capitis]PTH07480.1 hypothetical protein BU615_04295 [Staphylococcus capitis]